MTCSSRHRRLRVLGAAVIAVAIAIAVPALAGAKDRNHDNLPDRWERNNDLSLSHNQANRDQDRDGLENRGEFQGGMDPRDSDSDDDGVEDGDEDAGMISSFDPSTGELVINTFAGGPVSGMVTDETEIRCENEGPGDDHGDDGPGDDDDGDDRGDGGPGHGRDSHSGPGDGDDARDSHSGSGDGDDDRNCTVADLVAGAIVHEAELEATASGPIFEEVELR